MLSDLKDMGHVRFSPQGADLDDHRHVEIGRSGDAPRDEEGLGAGQELGFYQKSDWDREGHRGERGCEGGTGWCHHWAPHLRAPQLHH